MLLIVVVPLFLQIFFCANPVEQLIIRSCCLIIEHGENKIILLQESKLSKLKTDLSLFSFLSFFLSSFCVLLDWFLKDPSRKKTCEDTKRLKQIGKFFL
jgi:hypothetical protein